MRVPRPSYLRSRDGFADRAAPYAFLALLSAVAWYPIAAWLGLVATWHIGWLWQRPMDDGADPWVWNPCTLLAIGALTAASVAAVRCTPWWRGHGSRSPVITAGASLGGAVALWCGAAVLWNADPWRFVLWAVD